METLDGYLSHIRRPLSSLFQREDEHGVEESVSDLNQSSISPTKGKERIKKSKSHSQPSHESPLTDSSDDSEDEMDLIGRFSFAPFFSSNSTATTTTSSSTSNHGFMSLEHYHWLIQRYLAPYGEPSGIVAAKDPEIPPPIDGIEITEQNGKPLVDPQSSYQSYPSTARSILSNILSKKISISPSSQDEDEKRKKDRITRRKRKLRQRRLSKYKSNNNNNNHDSTNLQGPPPVLLTEKELRQKILEIKELNLSDRERDKLVQTLMTENYYRIRGLEVESEKEIEVENEYTNINDSDQDINSTPNIDNESDSHESDYDEDESDSDDIALSLTSSEDKVASYYDISDHILGCEHYQRGCKLQCSTCDKWYPCRICHDNHESHKLIRQKTRNMLCMYCKTPQPANQECKNCHETLSRYYCDICKLWDDDIHKSIFHCQDCGICRIGKGLGKDFFHCTTCNVCMSIELENAHRCIEHSTECDCPICGEFMFTSTETVVFMKCGHSIHQSCFREHTKSSYKCPTCQRSVINMEASFRILDTEIASQVLPEPYCNWRSIIVCNDCSAKSNVPFHFLGLKCMTCRSYNTSQMKLIKPEELEVAESVRPLINSAVDLSDVTIESDPESDSEAIISNH